MIAQVEVEEEIMRLSARCEATTLQMAKVSQDAAAKDAAYKLAHAKAFLRADGPVAQRTATALVQCEDEYLARKISAGLLLSAQEAGRNYRAQLDALRSINANLRPLVTAG